MIKMILKRLSLICAITFSISTLSTFAADSTPIFSTEPTKEDLKLQKNIKLDEKAWTIDSDGKKKDITPLSELPTVDSTSQDGTVSANFFSGGYYYAYNSYAEYNRSKDDYHFFVSAVQVYNGTSTALSLKYTQSQSVTIQWMYTGKTSLEAGIGNQMIANGKSNFGLDIARQTTENSGTSVEFTINVSPYKTGRIAKYKQGIYSGGVAYWDKYNLYGSWLGFYSENASSWLVDQYNDIFRTWEG